MKTKIKNALIVVLLCMLIVSCVSPRANAAESFERIAGNNRYETSYAIADELKSNLGIEKFDAVVVATGTNFPDALSGGYLATINQAPIVITNENNVQETLSYIENNVAFGGKIYIIGAAANMIDESLLCSYDVKKLTGPTRYETNLEVLREASVGNAEMLICTGKTYADIMSASATGKPIMLVGSDLSDEQKAFLSEDNRRFVIVGGINAVSQSVETELSAYGSVERIGGANRYETSVMIAERFFSNPSTFILVDGRKFPDGICGGPLAAQLDVPIILATDCLEDQAEKYFNNIGAKYGIVVGGETAVSNRAAEIVFTDKSYVGHNYVKTITKPTCTEDGYTTSKCSYCGKTVVTVDKNTAGHDMKVTTIDATTGFGGYDLHECIKCDYSYIDNKTPQLKSYEWPKGYMDETCMITVYKEWHENAYVYAAHVVFTDYNRLWMECANGKYNSGGETTSHAAKRVGAILAINGDFAIPANGASGYAIARKGVVYNDKKAYPEGVYNSNTGLLTFGHSGKMLSELVADGKVTDTFQFGPCVLKDGKIVANDPNSTYRAQSTFIGTNGEPGDIWMCVSDGRYNDGVSRGLNPYEIATYMQSKGCTLCVPLDGGGSSTIYFNGQVLNAAKSGQRAVVDFLVFK